MSSGPLRLGEGFGVELEYMIVDRETLSVRPLADALLRTEAADLEEGEVERGALAWSNELARHLVELKTNGPVPGLAGRAALFAAEVRTVDERLAALGARLMPTAMHPWMDPRREFALWPHGRREIYEAFDRVFDCSGHGWANLQSAHLNLSFGDDAEFERLHAAVRALLPLLPALAASSPLLEGAPSGLLDTRLHVYRSNAARVPSVSGRVIPEPVGTRAAYEGELLAGIYRDLAPFDPEGVLRHEWVNARGAIARFDRGAIEIRVLDVQECPAADLAIAAAVAAAALALARGECGDAAGLRALDTDSLVALLDETIAAGEEAPVADPAYRKALGLPDGARDARAAWRALVERHLRGDPAWPEWAPALELVLEEGTLARRILRRLGPAPGRARVRDTYAALCECLHENRPFRARA